MNNYQTIKKFWRFPAMVFAGGLFRAALEVSQYNPVAQTRAGSLCIFDWKVKLFGEKNKFKLIT
ncbi:hypothetical protein HN858_00425 [Candidatus Falkowbacteria bacterium]|jgi:hypothetical protein|nr:hypothetical protein [Candidatus Falkowbacteria bacterium]MBT7348118.1 hypothetical protein [Candidatus Falkowbacteria bacterium]MBT7500704.1 hypothetical protein [Candidatus Falkowbacteria bacterium]